MTVVDRLGKPVATGTGRGARVDWTWLSTGAKGGYSWTISAPGIRVATGTLGSPGRWAAATARHVLAHEPGREPERDHAERRRER